MHEFDYFSRLIARNEAVGACLNFPEGAHSGWFDFFKCPVCGNRPLEYAQASACCPPRCCPVCLREAGTYQEAADCCLHVHPTLDRPGRERIARRVEEGASWREAVAETLRR